MVSRIGSFELPTFFNYFFEAQDDKNYNYDGESDGSEQTFKDRKKTGEFNNRN